MISEKERAAITDLSRRYGVKRVLLFGSSAEASGEGEDIDLAVEGIAPRDFFRFYGDLMFALTKPVDLVDMSKESKFTRLIRREGTAIYG